MIFILSLLIQTTLSGMMIPSIGNIAISKPTLSSIAADTNSLLFDGKDFPNHEGWQAGGISNCGGGTTVFPFDVFHPYFSARTTQCAVNEYLKDSEFRDHFYVIMRVQIDSETSNTYDAGFTFSVFGVNDTSFGIWADRNNSFVLDPNQIKFEDDGDFYPLDTSVFHNYLITYEAGTVSLYVDQTYDDVLAGAVPVLTRAVNLPYLPGYITPGILVFGDTSNDSGPAGAYNAASNSTYQLDYITAKGM